MVIIKEIYYLANCKICCENIALLLESKYMTVTMRAV